MYKALIALSLVFPLSTYAYFGDNLYFGMQGNTGVSALQEFLTDSGHYTGPITGNFFSLTLKAVKAFQENKGISPVSGYFGPMTREAANTVLASQGISSGVTDESGNLSNSPTTAPKTNDDVVAKLNEQIAAVLKLVEELNKQRELLNDTQNKQEVLLGQIRENTTPAPKPVPAPVVVPEVKKEVKITEFGCQEAGGNAKGTMCKVKVNYLENGVTVPATVLVSADDTKGFFAAPQVESGRALGFPTPYLTGNPLTVGTYKVSEDNEAALLSFYPSEEGEERYPVCPLNVDEFCTKITRTVTVTVNGLSANKTITTRYYGNYESAAPFGI